MGIGSAFYFDHRNGRVDIRSLVKPAQETDPEFIKRCLNSCGSDCNIVKVERVYSGKQTGKCPKCQDVNFEFWRIIKFKILLKLRRRKTSFDTIKECFFYSGSFENFDMDWSDNEIKSKNYDLYDQSGTCSRVL